MTHWGSWRGVTSQSLWWPVFFFGEKDIRGIEGEAIASFDPVERCTNMFKVSFFQTMVFFFPPHKKTNKKKTIVWGKKKPSTYFN